MEHETVKEHAGDIVKEGKVICCCDLDNWQPEVSSGHSWVCEIHKQAVSRFRRERGLGS